MTNCLKELIPLLSIVVTALLGIITYSWQEWIKRKNKLSEYRYSLYKEWIRQLIELLVAKTGEDMSDLISEIEKGWLFASDGVLEAAYNYLNYCDSLYCTKTRNSKIKHNTVLEKLQSDEKIKENVSERLSNVFLSMRQDIRSDTKINMQWAQKNFKIYDFGIIAKRDKKKYR